MLTNFLYILLALLLLCVLIVVHEFGHFIVGRLCGIGVVEFAVGFGPKLFHWRGKETLYSIRAIPLGGFCKFVGEDDENPAPNAMNNMPVWKRFLTVAAGPAMNLLFAYLVGVVMLCMYYGTVVPQVDTLVEGMPAYEAELRTGDIVTHVNGEEVPFDGSGTDLIRRRIQESDSVELTVLRGGETLEFTLVPAVVTDEATGQQAKQVGFAFTFQPYSLADAIPTSANLMKDMSTMMLDFLRDLFFKGEGAEDMAGPIGTVAVVSQTLAVDPSQLLYFAVVISLNLAIMNLIPFPGLDGSRLVFLAIEGIRRKPVPPEKEGMIHGVGLVLLLALAVVLMWHDVMTYIIK
ncbi:MAG: site-2 protease family protein [Clostridia bacterium]|nr:site-2 protease family protein [Clostridia bacterium]